MASKLAWFATESGRYSVYAGTYILGFTLFSAQALPHTLGIGKYQEFVQMYRKAMEVPIPEKVIKVINDVMLDLKLTKAESKYIKPFTVYGFDPFHAGSTTLRTGAILGIPINFSYENPSDVDRSIKAVEKGIDWESPSGEALQKALVLSDNAKKFAIAREVSYLRTYYAQITSVIPLCTLLFISRLAREINKRGQLFSRPIIFRGISYAICSTFGLALYFFTKDFSSVSYDHYVDDEASNLGINYIEGGIEYYDKLLKRNIVLREILPAAEKVYTHTGNEKFFLRQKSMPLVHRKLYLQEKLKNLKEGNSKPLEPDNYVMGTKFNTTEAT